MSILPASGIGSESTGFYPVEIDQSLRFEDGSSSHLAFTPSSSNGRTKCTISAWVKRANIGKECVIFHAGTASTNRGHLRFNGDDTLEWAYYNGSWILWLKTTALFRDTTNWYHVVATLDTTDGTANLYVNGTIQDLQTSTKPSSSQDTSFGQNVEHQIGERRYGTSGYFDGYIAEVNFINGTDLNADSFGETKNGVWIPKAISGLTYGTNGFRLTFADSSSLGDDTSGNGNDFTASGLASTDVCTDSPTNNFANFSVLNSDSNTSLFEGGLRATMGGSGNYDQVRSDFGLSSGKWYWEIYVEERGYIPAVGVMAGYTGPSTNPTHWVTFGFGGWFITYNSSVPQYQVNQNSSGGTNWSVTMPANGDVIMIAIDVDNNKIWWGLNGTWYNSSGTANPATGTDARVTLTSDQTWHPMVTLDTGGAGYSNSKLRFNFGQESTFQGGKTAGTNSDENGNGLFQYAPPSGYLACCSSSLSDTTLSPDQDEQADDHFNTILYDGDGNSTNDITGVGFKPDFTWIKERESDGSHIASHVLLDSTRGYENYLVSNATNANGTGVSNNNSTRSNDGFQTTNSGATNQSGQNYVAWNWLVNGGTTSSNTVGDITSTVQVNQTAGISILTYTGNNTSGQTIGHGLGKKPSHIIVKSTSNAGTSWVNYHGTLGAGKYLALQSNQAQNSGTNTDRWNNTEPTTDVFTVGNHVAVNENTYTYVAYVFAEIEGYSKFGTYEGNGSTDGTYVFTGFRPAWIMFKRTDTADNWAIYDTVRDTINPLDSYIYADSSSAETEYSTAIVDALSNGFKWRGAVNFGNNSSGTYIYLAFAEQPFKFSNAR